MKTDFPEVLPGAKSLCGKSAFVLGAAMTLGLALRLFFALTTRGTNDVAHWQVFMNWIAAMDSFSIYEGIKYYNHPPLMSGYLWCISLMNDYLPDWFPLLIRLPSIIADMGSSLLVFFIGRQVFSERRALMGAASIALSPVLIMVSGFHGNTDPLFLFLMLAATACLVSGQEKLIGDQNQNPGNKALLAGFFLGLASNIKIVPLLFSPIFFFALNRKEQRIKLVVATVLVLLAGFGPHFVVAGRHILHNVFEYNGIFGIWGITKIADLGGENVLIRKYVTGILKLALIGGMIILAKKGNFVSPADPAKNLLLKLGVSTLFFFVFSPGFGVQYLAWIVVLAVFLDLRKHFAFQIVAGLFLFFVYNYWAGGWPWDYANSDAVGKWNGFLSYLDSALWLGLCMWFIGILKNLHGK